MAVGEPEYSVGRNGRLARDHQYISAVAVVGQRDRTADESPDGSYHHATVIRTLSPTAVPLPDVFFAGDRDRVFEPNEEGTAFVQSVVAHGLDG